MISGKILVNLDSEDDGEIFVGCAGGIDTTAVFHYNRSFSPENFSYFKMSVSGLLGGHSGGDIHLGRANANKIVARFIWECSQKWDIEVKLIQGRQSQKCHPERGRVGIWCSQ